MSFHFNSSDGQHDFRCNLDCQRCQGHARSTGQQCRKVTCKYLPLCFIHLKQNGLQVKQSNIPNGGDGLFTLIARQRNELIGEYSGEELTDAQLQNWYGNDTAPFAFKARGNFNVDPACERCYSAYANTARGSNYQNNCTFIVSHQGGTRVRVRTTKAVPANAELFVAYGANYWNNLQGTYLTSKYKVR